jgi:hypothetical protein
VTGTSSSAGAGNRSISGHDDFDTTSSRISLLWFVPVALSSIASDSDGART